MVVPRTVSYLRTRSGGSQGPERERERDGERDWRERLEREKELSTYTGTSTHCRWTVTMSWTVRCIYINPSDQCTLQHSATHHLFPGDYYVLVHALSGQTDTGRENHNVIEVAESTCSLLESRNLSSCLLHYLFSVLECSSLLLLLLLLLLFVFHPFLLLCLPLLVLYLCLCLCLCLVSECLA